jgi:predicted nucleotidyltransferase
MDHIILKVRVGSQAHGTAARGSDADVRGVYVMSTAEMFRLGFKYQGTRWLEDLPAEDSGQGIHRDETLWEVGQFLALGVQAHPLILEALLAPVIDSDRWGTELRGLLPDLWEPQQAYRAFTGYAANQRKKMLDKKDGRPEKYAAAYVRVLYNLCELLQSGRFTVRIADTDIGPTIMKLKTGHCRTGEVIDLGERWLAEADRRLASCRHERDPSRIDEFLVRIRTAFLVL